MEKEKEKEKEERTRSNDVHTINQHVYADPHVQSQQIPFISGSVCTLAGSPSNRGHANTVFDSASFSAPFAVCHHCPSDSSSHGGDGQRQNVLYVADDMNNAIRKLDIQTQKASTVMTSTDGIYTYNTYIHNTSYKLIYISRDESYSLLPITLFCLF